VRRLATNLDEIGLRRIRDATAALARRAKADDFDGAIQADLELHDLLIELTGNQPLRHAYRSLLNEIRLYIRLTSRHYGSIAELASEHADLIDALRDKRVDEAVRAMRRHIEHGLEGALADLAGGIGD
jgi:DNA-binding GntR family transcriptional regulator